MDSFGTRTAVVPTVGTATVPRLATAAQPRMTALKDDLQRHYKFPCLKSCHCVFLVTHGIERLTLVYDGIRLTCSSITGSCLAAATDNTKHMFLITNDTCRPPCMFGLVWLAAAIQCRARELPLCVSASMLLTASAGSRSYAYLGWCDLQPPATCQVAKTEVQSSSVRLGDARAVNRRCCTGAPLLWRHTCAAECPHTQSAAVSKLSCAWCRFAHANSI